MVEGIFIQFYIVVHWHDQAGPCQTSSEIIGPMKPIVDRSFFCSNGGEFLRQDFEAVIGTAIVHHHDFIRAFFIVGNRLEDAGQAFSQQFSAVPIGDDQSDVRNFHEVLYLFGNFPWATTSNSSLSRDSSLFAKESCCYLPSGGSPGQKQFSAMPS